MNPYLQDILHNITTRLAKLEEAQPESILHTVHCECGAVYKVDEQPYKQTKPSKKKEWVGLTDEEISELIRASHNTGSFVRVIEEKLKEKNHG